MKYLVLGLVAACSSPHALSDAGSSDAAVVDDATIDAPPDAPGPPCSTTIDLDGDGLGWECDPVEHLSLANASNPYPWFAYLADGVFAAHVGFHCSGASCADNAAIEIRPDRMTLRRSDSGLPEDAWLRSPTVGGPCIDAAHTVWWSSSATGMTGTLDSAGAFTPVASPLIGACIVVGNRTALLAMTTSDSPLGELTSTVAPGGGTLHPVATADFGRLDALKIDVAFAPAVIALASQSSLLQLHPGDTAPSDVIVEGSATTIVDEVTPIPADGGHSAFDNYVRSPVARYLVRRGGVAYVVSITATETVWARLPRTDVTCRRSPNDAVTYCDARDTPDGTTASLYAIRGSIVRPVFELLAGDAAPAVITGTSLQLIQRGDRVWAFDTGNNVALLNDDLTTVHTAVRDDVAFVVGVRASAMARAEVKRFGITGFPSMSLDHGADATYNPSMLVTPEYDLLVGGVAQMYVIQHQNPYADPFGGSPVFTGFTRGTNTVLVKGNQLWAYNRFGASGGPGFGLITTGEPGMRAYPLDPAHGPPTEYFAFGGSGPARIGKLYYDMMAPELLEVPCSGTPEQVHAYGSTHEGVPVAACQTSSDTYVFELPPTAPKLVAHFESEATIYADSRLADRPVVAWSGHSRTTHADTICRASSPGACWRIPFGTRTTLGVDSVADTFTLLVHAAATNLDLWILRPLGSGEEPQPVP